MVGYVGFIEVCSRLSFQIKMNLLVLVGFLPATRAEWIPQLSVPKSHGGESWTLGNMDNPYSSKETTTSAHIPVPRGTFLVPSVPYGHRKLGTARDRTLPVFV